MNHRANDYVNLDDRSTLPTQGQMAQQTAVPIANMMGTGSRHDAPSASVGADELDTWVAAAAEKANSKRDREDDDYTGEARKTASVSTPAKRQRQAAAKASATSPRTKAPKANDDNKEVTKAQRIDTADRIKAIWGFELGVWPVYDFIPFRVQKGAQQGRQPQRKAEPQDWNLGLLKEVLHLAQQITRDQRPRIAEILENVIHDRVVDSNSDSTMCAQDIQRTYQIMVQERSEAGPSRRSPTLAAAARSIEATEGDGAIQSHDQAERRDSPMVGDESADVSERAQDDGVSFGALHDSVFMKQLIENLIDKTPEFCGQCIEAIQEVQQEKEQHRAVLLEKAQRWRASFN